MMAGDPAGGIARGVVRIVEPGDDERPIELSADLVESNQRRAACFGITGGGGFAKSFVFADVDQGIDERMVESAVVGAVGKRGENRWRHGGIADTAEGFGGGPAVLPRRRFEQLDESGCRRLIAPDADSMNRGLADGFIVVAEGRTDRFASFGALD